MIGHDMGHHLCPGTSAACNHPRVNRQPFLYRIADTKLSGDVAADELGEKGIV